MAVCGQRGYSFFQQAARVGFFLRFISWFTDNSRNNSRKCMEIQENEGSRRNRSGRIGAREAAASTVSVARLSSRIYILKKALW
jgi:hypothetical protein